ncbi:peptidase M15B and M15C [Prochlorococcus phage P-HM2]|uniref:Peptidase M15B and M15C n=1 Tax=Prochlorococcus phage P-HM2 TaxID=445696 RepID=E3SSM2_9CAUD|nr:peptidase [Prochlorococcus phage P-HM2]ADO99800.1 peptidase M15B and M15C [Prochlorococcus phage P-HM2]
MDTSVITSFFKKAAKNLAVGIAGAIESSDDTKLVPAIAPIPVEAVDKSYGTTTPIEKPENEDKYEEVVLEAIKEVAQQRNLPYEKKPEVALEKGGIVKRETIAKVGEKEPEIVQPVKDYGESVEQIYKQGASLIISSSLGFLKTLPPSPAKASVIAEANRLKGIFGIAETPKPQATIGLKAPLVWWGGKKQTATGAPVTKTTEQTPEKSTRSFMGNPMRMLKNLKKTGSKGLKLLKKYGGKAGKGIRKVAASGTKLVKGAKKASMALLKKGSKKIATKLGGKAVAKVGAKALGKGLLKKIPFVGLGAGLLFAGQRLMAGDFKGAALEAMSGAASMIPGAGTAISIGLDATLAAKDMGVLPGQKKAEDQVGAAPAPDPSRDMYGRPIILNPPTMKAWKKAVNRAAKDGINLPMSVSSSYRSPEQQQALINAAEAGDENAINPAPVGQSPHGQGWAIDIDFYSKANEWMREKGKKFGFEWQGEGDPVHFDYENNEKNDKWLQPGKNKWIPNIDPVTSETKSSGAVKTASGTGSVVSAPSGSGSKETLNEQPVTQGSKDSSGNVVVAPRVVPVNMPPKEVLVYKWMDQHEIDEQIELQIGPMDKTSNYVLKYK